MRQILRLASFCLALLGLVSCGGGGSGGGGGSSGPSFSLSTKKLTFTALNQGFYVPPQTVSATTSGVTGGTLYFKIDVTGNAVQSVSNFVVASSTTGSASVIPASAAVLGVGTYKSTISVTACLNDPTCASGVLSGSPQIIDVTYQIGGIVTSPAAANFSVIEGTTPTPLDVGVTGDLLGGSLSAAIHYTNSPGGWLTVSPSTATAVPLTMRLSAATLPVGSYAAVVDLSANGFSLPFPVNYTVLPNLGVSTPSVSFAAVRGQAAMPAPMEVGVTAASGGPVSFSPSVVYGSGATGWLNVTGSTAPGKLSIAPNTTNLPSGATYTAAVSLAPTNGGSAPVVNVSYTVGASVLQLSSTSQSFSIDANSTSSDQYLKRVVATSDTGASLSWTANSYVPWLAVSSSGVSGDGIALTLVPAALRALPNGFASTTVNVDYSSPSGARGQLSIGVYLNLNLPSVSFVSPYIASANTPGSFILRGTGFRNIAGRPVSIGATSISNYTVISDSEIRADYPALTAGNYPVKIATGLGNDTGPKLAVVPPSTFPAAALAYANAADKQALRVIFDAERKALLVAVAYPEAGSGGDILRYTYNGTSWTAPISQYVPALRDMEVSPDGKQLIALTSSSVMQFNAETLASGTVTSEPGLIGGFQYLKNSAMTNDGRMLITIGVNGSGGGALRAYDLLSSSISTVGSYPGNYLYFGTPAASADGSRVVFEQGSLSPPPDVLQYFASTGALSATGTSLNQGTAAALDKTGSRILLNGSMLFDKNFVQIGSIPCGSAQTVLAPNGLRAYCYSNSGGTTLRTYDLSVSPVAGVFPEIGLGTTLAGNPGTAPKMAISPDGATLFIVGRSGIVIQPL